MKKFIIACLASLLIFVILIAVVILVEVSNFGLNISKSNIDGNVPDSSVFEEYLQRDLTDYVREDLNLKGDVEYVLLNEEPFQVGVGDAKYYLWVTVRDSSGSSTEGVAEVAAKEKKYFHINYFYSSDEILSNPDHVFRWIPESLYLDIDSRAKNATTSDTQTP